MSESNLPADLLIVYRGEPHIARKYSDADEYSLTCPRCGTRQSFEITGDERRGYRYSYGSHGVTLSPSLVCANDCGWHVTISEGVATDA